MNAKTFNDFRRLFEKNLWQSLEWSHFQVLLGNEVFFFGDDEAMAMAIIKKLPLGFSYIDIPRGPLGNTDARFWQELRIKTKNSKCVFARISPSYHLAALPRLHVPSHAQIFPENTLILDLSLSEEEILKQMKPKGRYNIRIAQRNKVKVFETQNVSDFYKLLQETEKRDGFSGHNESYYQSLLKSLGSNAKLYMAEYINENNESVLIAGGIFTFLDDTCTYYYGVSSNEYRNIMAPYLLQWHALSEAKKQGYKNYDFLGIAPEGKSSHRLAGVTRFKKQFGGEVQSYPASIDIIYKPFVYLAYRVLKFLRF